jgi:EAL domain-containing protein (putative c-di-GMP-specific phosphodiesterase class I)/GGDEF domain-containing protein
MSLLTRLWLSVLGAMLLVMSGSFVMSALTARNYLEQQLFAQASDSAASLALSMSQQSKDAAMSEVLVTALFDSGHFEAIVFRDVTGKLLFERHSTAPGPSAPGWFVRMIPLEARPGTALVSDGWRQAGKVEVQASARYAYGELWKGIVKLAVSQSLIAALLCAVVAALMRWLDKPLRAIVEQAEAIGQRRFEIKPLPRVKELRVVGLAMNTMVERVRAMFKEQAARIEQLRGEANRDPLTRLPNRSLFAGALRDALTDEQAAPGGVLVMCRVIDLMGINRSVGRERTDLLLTACGDMLRSVLEQYSNEPLLGRLNGADFGLLLPGGDAAEAAQIGDALLAGFARLGLQNSIEREPLAAIGWTLYRRAEAAGDVLNRADHCLMQAEAASPPLVGNAGEMPLMAARADEWRERLEQALQARAFELAFFPVVKADGAVLHQEAMLRMINVDGERLTAGQFMPAALRQGLIASLDLISLELAVQRMQQEPGDVAVNLSALSLDDPDFLPACKAILQAAGKRAQGLWVELAERGIGDAGGLDHLAPLARLLADCGAKLGIEHFGRHFASMPRLHALSVDYLKLDGAFVAEIESNEGNQRFVKAVVDVAGSLDIQVIAERVGSQAEMSKLAELGVAGMTGPAVTNARKTDAG